MLEETFTLSDGTLIPKIGLGTWLLDDAQAKAAVVEAVKVGYRMVDTAQAYGNEAGVGDGVRACGVPRDQLFIASKVPPSTRPMHRLWIPSTPRCPPWGWITWTR